MAEKRDYYEVLGVAKTATADEIKLAYRKAAMKWHPDRWVEGTEAEKKTAEEKFKEASEAYSVLSDPDKKAKYDQFGFAGVDSQGAPDFSGGFGNLEDILRDLFGGSFGGFGGFGGFGSGFGTGGSSRTQTRVYKGRAGQVQHVTSSLFGRTMTYSTCPQCGGEGKVITNPCRTCGGTGLVRRKEIVKVKIPAGVEDGMQLTIRGEGHAAPHNGVNGDLLVIIEEVAHSNLKRNGNNLFYSTVISVTDAILGTEIAVPCLDGSYKVKVDPGTQSGAVIKLRGKGLPAVSGYGSGTGDLYVKILVWIPKRLSNDEKAALQGMRTSRSFTPDLSRDDKAVFDKIKDIF